LLGGGIGEGGSDDASTGGDARIGSLAAGGVRPTSGGTGGGASLPSSAGTDAMPATAATTIAAILTALPHLIWRPATLLVRPWRDLLSPHDHGGCSAWHKPHPL
jgi:hypothetical protein